VSRALRLRILLGAAVLLGALLLAFLVGPDLRERITATILFGLWVASLVLGTLPQVLFWGVFLILALLLAFYSLYRERRGAPVESGVRLASGGRVSTLARWVRESTRGLYFRRRLAYHLLNLVLEARGHSLSNASDRGELLRSGRLDLPPESQDFLLSSGAADVRLNIDALAEASGGPLRRIALFIHNTLGGQPPPVTPGGPLEMLVESLEHDLEIQYDPDDT